MINKQLNDNACTRSKVMAALLLCFGILSGMSFYFDLVKNCSAIFEIHEIPFGGKLTMKSNFWSTRGQKCKPRLCGSVLREAVHGSWSFKKSLTEEDVKNRKRMDEEIRLGNGWPKLLTREDLRCGKDYTLPNHPRLFAQCDHNGLNPCCHHVKGQCGNTSDYCKCKECIDARNTISAELGDWNPRSNSCQIQYFTQSEACNLLNKNIKHLVFLGDSLVRQLSSTLYMILSQNFEHGALRRNLSQQILNDCGNEFQIASRECRLNIPRTLSDHIEPSSLCKGDIHFKFDWVVDYPTGLQKFVIDKLEELLNKTDSYVVLGIGLHYELNYDKVVEMYVGKIIQLIKDRGNGWPKLIWMGIHSVNGFLRADSLGRNEIIKAYNEKMHAYLQSHQIPAIDTFEMALGIRTYDGLHYGVGFNVLKLQILLNYLDERFERCSS